MDACDRRIDLDARRDRVSVRLEVRSRARPVPRPAQPCGRLSVSFTTASRYARVTLLDPRRAARSSTARIAQQELERPGEPGRGRLVPRRPAGSPARRAAPGPSIASPSSSRASSSIESTSVRCSRSSAVVLLYFVQRARQGARPRGPGSRPAEGRVLFSQRLAQFVGGPSVAVRRQVVLEVAFPVGVVIALAAPARRSAGTATGRGSGATRGELPAVRAASSQLFSRFFSEPLDLAVLQAEEDVGGQVEELDAGRRARWPRRSPGTPGCTAPAGRRACAPAANRCRPGWRSAARSPSA